MADTAVLDTPLLDGSLDGTAMTILYKPDCVFFVLCLPIPCPPFYFLLLFYIFFLPLLKSISLTSDII